VESSPIWFTPKGCRNCGVDSTCRICPCWNIERFFVKPLDGIIPQGRFSSISVFCRSFDSCWPMRQVSNWASILVEPSARQRIRQAAVINGAALRPNRLCAQADCRLMSFIAVGSWTARLRGWNSPGGFFRHFHAAFSIRSVAVHDHGAFAIERCGVKRTLRGSGHLPLAGRICLASLVFR